MLVQALAEYADHYLSAQLNDTAWEEKPVPWALEISRKGAFLTVIPRMTSIARGKKQVQVPMRMRVPRSPVNRNSGEHPLLGTDDIAYVLGPGPWTADKAGDKARAEKHHQAYVALLQHAAEVTGDEALASCVLFYDRPEEVEKARAELQEAKAGALVALSSGGALVERGAVQTFWRRHYQEAFAARMEGYLGECLISGKTGAIAPTHEKIKGVTSLGGRAEVGLMSFDKEAFRSYGWEQNQNSPVSPDRAMAYVLALNDLLGSDEARIGKGRRKDIAGVGFLTWLRDPADFDALDIMERADPKEVGALLKFDPRADPDANRFYLVGVSGNGARLRVRYWVTESLPMVKENLKNWHQQLRVSYPWDNAPPARLRQLLDAIHRKSKSQARGTNSRVEAHAETAAQRKRNPPAHDTIALLRRGLEGASQPLGYGMLAAALIRLRHPGGNTPEPKGKENSPFSLQKLRIPMGLIRMCLNDIARPKGKKEMSEGLDQSCNLPAYVCGRLMAEYENLQSTTSRRAEGGEVNSTVTDRFFSLASTYPAAAFSKIIDLGQKHLKKLRRFDAAAAFSIERRLMEINKLLQPSENGAYPANLSLEGQGLFALGYYHQKAWSRAQAKDHKQSSDATNENTEEMD
jgi:CRISPR-associated protein Csd1